MKYKKIIQFFAIFIEPKRNKNYWKEFLNIYSNTLDEFNKNKEFINLCVNYKEIEATILENKIVAFLTVEGGELLDGKIDRLEELYKKGIRSICLTWNYTNEIADGVLGDKKETGLTSFGEDVVSNMNRLGMIIDLSHISKKSFYKVMDVTNKPVICSHSNAYRVCQHERNLSDDQILEIKKNHGVIGINAYPDFLTNNKKSTVIDIIKHIEYIVSLIGCDNIGLGFDLDGIGKMPSGFNGVEDTHNIINELGKLNYKNTDIEKIVGKNFLRVIKEVLV